MRKSWRLIALVLVLSLVLSACGKNAEEVNAPKETEQEEKREQSYGKVGNIELPYPTLIEKDGETVGGTLNVALVTSTPFEGLFNTFLYENDVDYQLLKPMLSNFFKSGPNHEMNDGYCSIKFDKNNKKATLKIHPNLTWSDGVPVTADDLIFVYECIGHKDYTGVRYDSDYMNVVGMEEYHAGKADTISGLKKIDDKTLEVTFKEFYPSILWGAGIPYDPEPKHYLKDIPLKEMESHEKIRLKPLSCGPFMISNIVLGESVEYVPNPHWCGEKPKVDKMIIKRTNPDTIVEALASGAFDVVEDINVNSYDRYKDLSNITLLSNVSTSYNYIGFKLGKWDAEKGQVIPNPNAKLADVRLRQAIAYAMNNKEVAEIFYHNLRIPANTLIDPSHTTFWNAEQEGYDYNPEKAKQILDEAVYVDVDGDGFREDPKGNKLKINFLSMAGGEIAEPLAQYYIQCWRDIGLDVVLQNGRLVEMNAFYDMVEQDNPEIDLYMAGWITGSNPDPSGLYGRYAMFNYIRFASEENDRLLAAIASEKAFGEDGSLDEEYLIKAYHDWQAYVRDQVVAAPTFYRIKLTALNNRVSSWDMNVVSDWWWDKVGLLSDTPEVAK